jgi:GNAT superfamily N-acetyltransferase
MHHSTIRADRIEIRRATSTDAVALASLGSACIPRTAADAALFLVRDDAGAFIARRGGAVVGTAWFVVDGEVLRCFDLVVARPSRNGGVGSALLAALEAEGASRASAVIHIEAALTHDAIEWLARRGFAVDAAERDVVDGAVIWSVEMTKLV